MIPWHSIGQIIAYGLAFIGLAVFCGIGIAHIILSIHGERAARHLAREEAAQREADEHMFDLISKGQGGAI
jgi:hypothetical protein